MPPDRLNRLIAATHAGIPDAELVRRVADTRDEAAFELLVRRHATAVWKICRGITDHHAAEDAFQATFLALLRKAGSLRTNPAGWLARVATRAALKARRRLLVLPNGFDTATPDLPEPDDTGPLLHAELDRLSDRYRLPIVLCHLHGLTQAEAAARLGWPLGTVATRVKRGCEALRKRLARRGIAFTLAFFGTGAVSESVVASAMRLLDPTAVSPTTTQLTAEVLRMMNPNPVRWIVLTACGLLAVGGMIGLWPESNSPVAPTATAAPVPPVDKTAELEEAWLALDYSPQAVVRAVVRLHSDPKATTAFLKKRMRPVTVDEKSAKKVLADLESDDEKTWQAAYRSIKYYDPRLALSLSDVFAAVKTDIGRHRLYHALMVDRTPDDPVVAREAWYHYDDPVENDTLAERGWYNLTFRPTDDAPRTVGRVDSTVVIPGKAKNVTHHRDWNRAAASITLLELFATPEAVELLTEMASGHPDVYPTTTAKEALGRLKKK